MPSRRRALLILASLVALALLSLLIALAAGSLPVSAADVVRALGGKSDGLAGEVINGLRLPRALAAFACGGLLALAGALMQVLLRNPLADPYVLGISGGAAVGALSAMLAGLTLALMNLAAFAGALAVMLLVFGLAHGDSSWTRSRLLLTGVIVAAGCGALVALILSIAPEDGLRGMLFWLMGDVGHAVTPWPALIVLAAGVMVTLPFARELNLLARGDTLAHALGGFREARPRRHLSAGISPHRRCRDYGGQHRFHRPGGAASGAAGDEQAGLGQRPAPAAARIRAGRRQPAGACRHAGAYRDCAAAVAGRRTDRSARGSDISVPARTPAE